MVAPTYQSRDPSATILYSSHDPSVLRQPIRYRFTRVGSDGTTGSQLSPWSGWGSSPPGCPRRECTRCGTRVVGPCTASCEGPSPQRPASRGSNLPPARSRLDGAGRVCSSGCVPWTWSAALAVPKAPCGPSPPSLAGLSCSLSWRLLLSPLKLAAAPCLWHRPAWSAGGSSGPVPQLLVMSGGSGLQHGRGRPLGATW